MKRFLTVFLSLVLMLTLTACVKNEDTDSALISSNSVTNSNSAPSSNSEKSTTNNSSSQKNSNVEEAKITSLPLPQENTQFVFSSGAGAWSTSLSLNKSASFSGDFHDSEMGSMADEYPHGTVYISIFNGEFTNIEKINDYSYKMTLTRIETRDKIDKEWIDNQIRYVATTPYGLEGGTEFILYLPNTPISELSEDFLYWWPLKFEHNQTPKTTLSCYGILNAATNDGFFTTE